MFNKNEPKYQALLRRLQQMGDRKILTVYVAETGESVNKSHPLRVAVQEIQDLLLPVIFLQELPGTSAPVMNDANSLDAKITAFTHRFWPFSKGEYLTEIILTSAHKTHLERTGNLLEALSEDGARPDEILLIGERQCSRLCNEMTSKIQMKFGHDVKLHFLEYVALVPGHEDYEKNTQVTQQSYASIINAVYGAHGMERGYS